jgi:hypothetical protein
MPAAISSPIRWTSRRMIVGKSLEAVVFLKLIFARHAADKILNAFRLWFTNDLL